MKTKPVRHATTTIIPGLVSSRYQTRAPPPRGASPNVHIDRPTDHQLAFFLNIIMVLYLSPPGSTNTTWDGLGAFPPPPGRVPNFEHPTNAGMRQVFIIWMVVPYLFTMGFCAVRAYVKVLRWEMLADDCKLPLGPETSDIVHTNLGFIVMVSTRPVYRCVGRSSSWWRGKGGQHVEDFVGLNDEDWTRRLSQQRWLVIL